MINANVCETSLLESAIANLFAQAIQEGKITLTDSHSLVAALFNHSLSEAEEDLIYRLLYAVRRGRLKVIDSE
ncbi:MAG TPA: hypothetical protein V6C91_18855 [Coleofasciculaceae cyanobacterium]